MSSTATSANVRIIGIAFGGLVAGVAAVASYTHMRELTAHHAALGSEWLSWLIPLSVDGLMVVASIVVVNARRTPAATVPPLAIIAIIVGLAASLVANAAAPAADIVGKIINAWPAAAFALGYELVFMLVRTEVKTRVRKPKTAPAGVVPSPVPAGATSEVPNPRAADSDVTTSESDAPATAAPAVGASLHIVAEAAPEWLTEELRAQPKAAMWRYLDEHGEVSGAVLDRFGAKFLGTKPTLGRKVRRDWLAAQEQKASGE